MSFPARLTICVKYFTRLSTVIILAVFFSKQVNASDSGFERGDKPLPKWEVGGFIAGFHSPLYPASKDNQDKFLALPYAVYRGDKFRIGDGAIVKAMAVEAPRFKLDISLNAAFNADSDDSDIREDMPDLDFLFEVGPQFRFLFSESSFEYGADQEVWLNLQTRAVFSTDFSELNHRGYTIQPQLSWRAKNVFLSNTISFASVSPIWASEKLHDYFYQVSPDFETVDRNSYDANAGYLGTKLSVGNIFQITPKMNVFFAAQWGLWQGAENKNSPLFQQQNNFSVALGLRYTFFVSDEKV